MKLLTPTDPETKTPDMVAGNIEQLRSLFPEAVTEGKVDFEVLKQILGGVVDEREEKYGLNWHGKRRARQLALTPSTGTLRPCPEESMAWDTTQNLMIEGDNLEVLKLLQKSYAGRVKLIYIDPPYNTGKDFVYPDNFQDSIKNYLELTGQMDGNGNKISSNTEASGRFHTDWLNMMYPRLKLGRNLLRDDGVIFITIDDSEVGNLLAVMNEIFGEENHVATIAWQKKYSVSNNSKGVASMKDYLVMFARSDQFKNGLLPRDDESKARYVNLDNDPRGPWKPVDYWNQVAPEDRPNLVYPITNPNTGQKIMPDKKAWKFSRDVHDRHVRESRIWWGVGGTNTVPALKLFLSDVRDGLIPHDWWPFDEAGHTDEAKKELDALFDSNAPFDTPKPVRLLTRMFQVGNVKSGDIVVDFFAGSGTTGHATFALNAADDGCRRFILVQLPEPTERKDYPTIADVTKERLRRAAKKIREEAPMFVGDLGFRVCKLASSNIRAWDPDRENLAQTLEASIEHLKADRTEPDILFELLLKLGLDLTVPIEDRAIAGKTVHSIGAGTLLVCLAPTIAADEVEPLALGIIGWHRQLDPAGETRVVFRDSAFPDDVTKTNLTAILQQNGLENVRSL